MGFNADDFLLVRNPAIKIIGKRNEREGGTTSTSSHRPEVSAKTAAAPRNQDSTGAAATWKPEKQQQQPAAAPSSPSTLPPPSPANEKPEPRLATTSSGTAAVTAAGAAVPQPVPESSQLWSSKEEASSRLEALLKNTATHGSATPDKNDRQERDLKNQSRGLCHLVRFEARRPQPSSQQPPAKSRLPRPVVDLPDPDPVVLPEQQQQPVQHTDDLTDLWSETHKDSFLEDALGQEKAGKRYRSSIRIMVRPEAVQQLQKPAQRANSSDGLSRSTSTSSEAARSLGQIILMFLFTYSNHRWRCGRRKILIIINYRL